MPSLQIRDLPEPLHEQLTHRARQQNRSLAQQALSDLQRASGGDPRERRQAVLARIRQRIIEQGVIVPPDTPEAMVRADRDR